MLFIGPAYIANAMMVFTKTINYPMDGGRYFRDGRRLFGQTKTWGGFLGGVLFGFTAGLTINLIFWFSYPSINSFAITQLSLLKFVDLTYLRAFLYPNALLIPVRALFCGLGAPIGDLVKSFFKRRLSIGSGGPFWIADQLDFIVATVLLNLAWFPLNIYNVLLLLFMTPSVTLFANYIAYMIGRKKEPW
jgi:CDP-2,3-bis-(O-geranylgeranyl)-sn-glycerol synthase